MVAEAEKLWKKHRMRKVYTCTSHINQRAFAFYKSLGFEQEGLLKSHFFDGIDEIQLGKFYKYDD
jgi:ribosomal protein S18 acetylase RimI-like enzyme